MKFKTDFRRSGSVIFRSILVLFVIVGASMQLFSAARIGSSDYTNLKAAFDAINAGDHTGAITIQITSNLSESAAAVLNASGTGSASYSSVTIYPTGTYTISGSVSLGLIELRGADNVTIDGRVNQSGSTNSLTIDNNYTSTSCGIWLDSLASSGGTGARNNTIQYVNVTGTGVSTSYGIVAGSSASLTTAGAGIDNNKFYNNKISDCYYGYRIYGASGRVNKNNEFKYNEVGGGVMYYCFYIYYHDGAVIENNKFEDFTSNSTCYGIYNYQSINPSIRYNSFKNLSITGTHYSIYNYYGSNGIISDNTVDGVSSTSTMYCIYNYYGHDSKIENNTVLNIEASTNCWAIYNNYANNCLINKNHLGHIRSYGTGGYSPTGIYVYGSGTNGNNDTLTNNVIYHLTSTNYSNSSTTYNPFGIRLGGGTGHKIWYNSVNLYGEQSGTNSSGTMSCALLVSASTVSAIDVRNNVFSNSLIGLSGSKSYAIYLYGTGNLTGSTFNYNDYYASGTYGILGYSGSTDISTIGDWRTFTSGDANSFASDPTFNLETNLQPLPGSPLLAAATPISYVTEDFQGNTRSGTAPTVGAYEQAGEFAGPTITFTPLAKTTSTANRVLTNFAEITDYSGIDNVNAPRLYYKKSTDNNTYTGNTSANNGWKYVSGTASGDMYSFTIDYSKLQGGSVSIGDDIDYFIVAQDLASTPNISVANATLDSDPSSVALTSTHFPASGYNSYKIAPQISGTFYVGSGEDHFYSLSRSDGAFNYLNGGVLIGNVELVVTSDLLYENGAVGLQEYVESGAGNYTVKIRPYAATNYEISGTAPEATGLIRFEGADRVTIDGSVNGQGKYFTFISNATSGTVATIQFASMGPGAKNNTIMNCKIKTGLNGATSFGIYAANGPDNDDLLIHNNEISKAYYGIYIDSDGERQRITDNIIGSESSSDYIGYRGIYVLNAVSPQILRNTVFNMKTAPSTNIAAIELGGTVDGADIMNNKIYGIQNPNSGGWGAYGISIIGGTNFDIINNMIWDLSTMNYSASSTSYNPFGIKINSGSNFNIYHNTIHMYGRQGSAGSAGSFSACLLVSSSAVTGLKITNNIFSNGLEGASGTKSYSMYMYNASPSGQFDDCDYNNYYAYGSYGILAGYGTTITDLTDLTAIQNTYRDNSNSSDEAVEFLADDDLHLSGSSVGNTNLYSEPLSGVYEDIDDESRKSSNTYRGADEVVSFLGIQQNLAFTPNLPVYCANTSDVSMGFRASVTGFADGIAREVSPAFTYEWYRNDEIIEEASGTSFTLEPVMQSDSADYYVIATFDGNTITSQTKNLKAETEMALTEQPLSADVCSTDPTLVINSASAGTVLGVQWQKEYDTGDGPGWMDLDGQTSQRLELILANAKEATGNYRMRLDGPGNCGPRTLYSAVASISVAEPITYVNKDSTADLQNICVFSDFQISVDADGTIYGYQWQIDNGGKWLDLDIKEYPDSRTNTLTFTSAQVNQTGSYRCMVYGSPRCVPSEMASTPFNITIWPQISFIDQPISADLCRGGSIELFTWADGTVYSFQWQKDGIDIPLSENQYARDPYFYLDNADFANSGNYRCKLDIVDCSGRRFIYSDEAVIYVHAQTQFIVDPPEQFTEEGGTATFEVKAHADDDWSEKIISVQWYRGAVALEDNDRIAGARQNILTISKLQTSDYGTDYWVVINALCGSDTLRGVSVQKQGINLITQPEDVVLCENGNAVFSVSATGVGGTGLSYQWYKGTEMLVNGPKYSGVKTNTLIVNNVLLADESTEYYVKIDLMTTSITVNSNNATLDANEIIRVVTDLNAAEEVQVDRDLTLTFDVTGEPVVEYKWFKDGTEIPGYITNTYDIMAAALTDEGTYYCVATNICGDMKSVECYVTVSQTDITGVDDAEAHGVKLLANYPNPFSNITNIEFTSNAAKQMRITLIDMTGREIATLFNGTATKGLNKVQFDASALDLSSGVYTYLLQVDGAVISKQMVIIR